MNWDVWTGTAPLHPYNSKYDPGNWRGWYDYGNGAFGDWGPHTLDTVHRFLELGLPHTIRAEKIEKPNEFISREEKSVQVSITRAINLTFQNEKLREDGARLIFPRVTGKSIRMVCSLSINKEDVVQAISH